MTRILNGFPWSPAPLLLPPKPPYFTPPPPQDYGPLSRSVCDYLIPHSLSLSLWLSPYLSTCLFLMRETIILSLILYASVSCAIFLRRRRVGRYPRPCGCINSPPVSNARRAASPKYCTLINGRRDLVLEPFAAILYSTIHERICVRARYKRRNRTMIIYGMAGME